MNFTETTTFSIVQISTFFKIEIEKQLKKTGLHAGQVFILFELWKSDGLSQIELSSKLKISPPAINKMVKSLMKNGFVINTNCQHDKRVMRVFLTPTGAAVFPQVEEIWKKIEERLLANLTSTEQLVLAQLFSKLAENLHAKDVSTT